MFFKIVWAIPTCRVHCNVWGNQRIEGVSSDVLRKQRTLRSVIRPGIWPTIYVLWTQSWTGCQRMHRNVLECIGIQFLQICVFNSFEWSFGNMSTWRRQQDGHPCKTILRKVKFVFYNYRCIQFTSF